MATCRLPELPNLELDRRILLLQLDRELGSEERKHVVDLRKNDCE